MKPVREIVSREIIDDLWGAGYTILPRARHPDPFYVPPEMVPQSRSYQWFDLKHDKFHFEARGGGSLGWAQVPASRHDGYFMPAGFVGDIEVNGLGLFEKPKFEVDAEHAANAAKAKKMVDDWAKNTGALFEGEFKIGNERTVIGATKTIEDATKIPRELTPYIAQIFEERDSLYSDLVGQWNSGGELTNWQNAIKVAYELQLSFTPDAPLGPTLNRLILPTAIENVRKRIAEEATSGQASEY
jgi:hypothetical protein